MSTSEQTSASNSELIEALKYALERIRDFDPKGDEHISNILGRTSPQQQPDTNTFEHALMIEVIARFAGRNSRGTSIAKEGFIDGAKWANERAVQPDELSKAQERIRELEAAIKEIDLFANDTNMYSEQSWLRDIKHIRSVVDKIKPKQL